MSKSEFISWLKTEIEKRKEFADATSLWSMGNYDDVFSDGENRGAYDMLVEVLETVEKANTLIEGK